MNESEASATCYRCLPDFNFEVLFGITMSIHAFGKKNYGSVIHVLVISMCILDCFTKLKEATTTLPLHVAKKNRSMHIA
jgi:hypothetical protein